MHDIFKLYDPLAKKQLTSLLLNISGVASSKRKYGRVLGRILNKSTRVILYLRVTKISKN